MNSLTTYDELDQAIDRMITASAEPESTPANLPPGIGELLTIASDLRGLARTDFKSRLMLELEWEACGRTFSIAQGPTRCELEALPTLSGKQDRLYPVRGVNMAASAVMHAALLLLIGTGFVMVKSTARVADQKFTGVTVLDPYLANAGSTPNHGGGGSAGAGKQDATKGEAPRFAREQIAPPAVNTAKSRIMVEATLIGPPELNLPKPDTGDPLARLLTPAAGMGTHVGIGNGIGNGVGPGKGSGRGPGWDGGFGGGPYLAGNGLSAPRVIYSPEPDYSDEARHSKFQGIVVLWVVIGADGRPANLRVARSLGMGLDEKALEAVRTWRFEPGKKDGHPVAVQISVEVDFRLF